MKTVMIIASFVALVTAEPPLSAGYGVPQLSSGYPSSQQYSGPQGPQGGQVYRHVYIHSAPNEPLDVQNRVIRVPGGGDKHVNVIFVKAPSQSSHSQTEVILPEQNEQKTVVYVLVKKGEYSNDVKIRAPGAPAPQKPEVFFIRYKNNEGQAQQAYGPVSAPVAVPQSAYGAY